MNETLLQKVKGRAVAVGATLAFAASSFILSAAPASAAASLVQSASNSDGNVLSYNVTLSSTPTAGNLLVAVMGSRGCSSVDNATPTGITGWTEASNVDSIGTNPCLHLNVFYKIAGGAEGTTVTANTVNAAAGKSSSMTVYEYTGGTFTHHLNSTATEDNTMSVPTTGALTTTSADELLIAAVLTADDATGSSTFSGWLNSFIEQHDLTNPTPTTSNISSLGVAHRLTNSIGSNSSAATYSSSATRSLGHLIAFTVVSGDVNPPTFTVNSGTDAGPVMSDTINVTVNDANLSGTQSWGVSADNTCDGSDTYPNSFTSGADFSVAGDYTTYLCVTSTDTFANTGYALVGQLNTDNTAPVVTLVTAVDAPTDRTPNYVYNSTEGGTIGSYGGSCASTATVVSSGSNVLTLGLPPTGSGNLATGVHADCTFVVTDAAGNASLTHEINDFNTVAGGGGGGGSQPPTVTIALPNGGETFAGGTTTNIVWSSGGDQVESTRVSYSTNGGTSWTVASNSGDLGFYTWTVPMVGTSAAKVKVELLVTGGAVGASDESDSAFTITVPAGTPTDAGQNTGEDQGSPLGSGGYVPAQASSDSPTINVDKELDDMDPPANPMCVSGSLIKLPTDNNPNTTMDSTVYYCGNDGKRYVFPNLNTFFTWFSDFSSVVIVDAGTLAQIPLGGNVTYKPGSRMIKLTTDPKVYAVDNGGVLRHVSSEVVAVALYGTSWQSFVDDVSDAFMADYTIGEPIL